MICLPPLWLPPPGDGWRWQWKANACTIAARPCMYPPLSQHCENILHGYIYVSEFAFVILKGIYGFKFPKRFLEISSRDLTSFPLQLIYRPNYQSICSVPFAFAQLNAFQAAVTMSLLSYTSKLNTDCV